MGSVNKDVAVDDFRVDGGIVAAIVGVVTGGMAVLRMVFNLATRVENNERDIVALKTASGHELDLIRRDIAEVSQRTEKRHDVIESKIDRLIERSMPK